jgi:ketosteroid isomerase-like protein
MRTTHDSRQQIITDYLTATIDRDVDRVGSFLTDDCRVWLPPSAAKLGLPRPLEGREAFLDLVRAMLDSSAHWVPRSLTPYRFLFGGDTVGAHLRLLGDMPNGGLYDNDYVFLFTFSGEKISEIREFTDTAFINDFLTSSREDHEGA